MREGQREGRAVSQRTENTIPRRKDRQVKSKHRDESYMPDRKLLCLHHRRHADGHDEHVQRGPQENANHSHGEMPLLGQGTARRHQRGRRWRNCSPHFAGGDEKWCSCCGEHWAVPQGQPHTCHLTQQVHSQVCAQRNRNVSAQTLVHGWSEQHILMGAAQCPSVAADKQRSQST